jgi:EAL domain-containing protein (putative c-di-GMP-specific phosphodiesterase class I)
MQLERLAVNLSPRSIMQPGLPEYIEKLLKENHIPSSSLELELTETTLMEYSVQAARFFETIDNMGVRLAIDDFGTSHSSLVHIKQLPIHTLKIDSSIVRDIGLDSDDLAIIRGVIAFAHSLDLEVIAEGVEHQQQFELLESLDCDLLQGWYYSPAVPSEEISRLFAHDMLIQAVKH